MSRYNVGDRVRIINAHEFFNGLTGTIVEHVDSRVNQIKLDKPVVVPVNVRGDKKTISSVFVDDDCMVLVSPKSDPEWKDIWDSNE